MLADGRRVRKKKTLELVENERELRKKALGLRKKAQRLRKNASEKDKTLQAELNIFYVAITRAKKRLIDKSSNAELYVECNDWYYSDVLIL